MFYLKKHRSGEGFTLVEMIIVVAIIGVVTGLSIPFLQSFRSSSDLYSYSDTILKTLRRAKQQAIIGQNSGSWGVYFDTINNNVILYKGSDYGSRDSSFDLVTGFPDVISFSTSFSDDITFSLYSGDPSVAGSVTSTNNHDDQVISISNEGLIQINE